MVSMYICLESIAVILSVIPFIFSCSNTGLGAKAKLDTGKEIACRVNCTKYCPHSAERKVDANGCTWTISKDGGGTPAGTTQEDWESKFAQNVMHPGMPLLEDVVVLKGNKLKHFWIIPFSQLDKIEY